MLLDDMLTAHIHARSVPGLDDLLSERHYREYLLACLVEEKSDRTLEVYAKVLGRFVIFLKAQGQSFAVDQVTPTDVRLFFLAQKQKTWRGKTASLATVHQYYRTLKTFFRWLVREEILKVSPMQNVRPPETPKILIKPFRDQDISNFLVLTQGRTFLALRNRAIVLLFMECGLRLQEMADLSLSKIDLEHGTILVFGKGRKERVVPLGKSTQRALLEYLAQRTDELPGVWLSEERTPLNRPGIQTLIYRICKQAGVKTKMGPHTFRHTTAHRCKENGMTIEEIQTLLGHSSPETTRRYLGTFDPTQQMVAAHRRASPVDRFLAGRRARTTSAP
jgi:site-specific recombinase XerD